MTSVTVGEHEIEISNREKVLFPADGITKGDLVEYYRKVAGWMIPHLEGRPLVMERFPDGIDRPGFFQKAASGYFPGWIERAELAKRGGTVTHVVCNDAATLVYLANQAMVTPHTWLSRVGRPTHPDQLIFDLDPGDDATVVPRAAAAVRGILDELGLTGFAKTSGSRGIHVHVPIDGAVPFEEAAAFALDVARVLEHRHPEELSTAFRKAERHGRLFVDTLRNAYAQHAVAPYGVRAKPGAPVAVPLDWDEATSPRFDPQRVTVGNAFRRLSQKQDPWEGMMETARALTGPRTRLDELLADV